MTDRRKKAGLSLLLIVFLAAPAAAASPATWPLVQQRNISYLGAFRLPNQDDAAHSRRLGYGGNALGHNPVNNSLFIGGHDWYQLLCEVSIPQPSKASAYQELPLATVLQPCRDVTEGTLDSVKSDAKLGGSFVYNGRLITSAYSYYDADCSQTKTHGVSTTLNLATNGDFSGFKSFAAAARPRALAGYMTTIPQAWQSLFGGPALTGIGGLAIISCASSGLAATVFDPDDIGRKDPVPGTTLLNYPDPGQGLAKELFYWLNGTATRGIAFPEGSRSVLFVGRQGDTTCYGGAECNDPCDGSKGVHSYPYHIKIWAYDANELLKVKAGQQTASQVRPYGIWTLPELETAGCAGLRGAAFDPARGRLYITPNYGEQPLVHVFQITVDRDVTAPAAPARWREQ